MGLMTILKKVKQKEKEVRLLMLYGDSLTAAWPRLCVGGVDSDLTWDVARYWRSQGVG